MAGKYNDLANVDDFIEHKMHRLIEQYAKLNREDIATVLSDALDKYLMGEHEIVFIDGWPHIVKETFKSDKGTEQI
jgi:hypothetical protein|tara:strand:- start:8477 stop:8704 length:228 start_codon:yes stop_codon:yes gene_type:complete